jgi:hypothetical protein
MVGGEMVDRRAGQMSTDDGMTSRLIAAARRFGVELVRHGSFVGMRGPGLGRVPPELWDLLGRNEGTLRQTLPQTPTPYQARLRVRWPAAPST